MQGSITKAKGEERQQPQEYRSRAKYRCPEKLERYITLFRLVPPKQDVPNPWEVVKRCIDERKRWERAKALENRHGYEDGDQYEAGFYEDAYEFEYFEGDDGDKDESQEKSLLPLKTAYEESLADLPEEFRSYVDSQASVESRQRTHSNDQEYSWYFTAVSIISNFATDRSHLRMYVRVTERIRKHGSAAEGAESYDPLSRTIVSFPAPRARYMFSDRKDGHGLRTIVEPDGISAALNGVISDRVRFCSVCDHVFWASRKDSEACSLPCANLLRVRRSRSLTEEEKSRLKKQREANRQVKKVNPNIGGKK